MDAWVSGLRGMRGLRRPHWWAVALMLLGVAVFARLGVWQLHRATYKEQLLQRFAHANSAPLIKFSDLRDAVAAGRYPHVAVSGHFLQHRTYLLDDAVHANREGVEVYAPFAVHDRSRLLLVDLGFLPLARNNALPTLPPLKPGTITLHGLYAPAPKPGLKLGGNQLPNQHAWPKTSIFISLPDIGADLGRPMFPRVLLTDPDPAVAYVRQWVPDTMPPSRHRAYALQWFTFAAASIAIFIVLNRKRPTGHGS